YHDRHTVIVFRMIISMQPLPTCNRRLKSSGRHYKGKSLKGEQAIRTLQTIRPLHCNVMACNHPASKKRVVSD
ncbi:MAG: hypothetical protein ACPG51_02290, partial [Thiolinea sp.]